MIKIGLSCPGEYNLPTQCAPPACDAQASAGRMRVALNQKHHSMRTRRLGRTGLKVSEICLGTMTFGHQCDEETSFAIMNKAADQGVYFIDSADVYPVPPSPETAGRTEEIVGSWLQGQR